MEKEELKQIRDLLVDADSTLGHLSHRCGIKWNDLESISKEEVDNLCWNIRRKTDELATCISSQ